MRFNTILLASHDTLGARAAERLARSLCKRGGTLSHLYVVPDFWKGMMGDDWLNNAVTRARFGTYVESQLTEEMEAVRQRLEQEVTAVGLEYGFEYRFGRPAECLVEVAERHRPDLVVIGSPRPKGTPGYRSRMDLKILARRLTVPLLTAPYPLQAT